MTRTSFTSSPRYRSIHPRHSDLPHTNGRRSASRGGRLSCAAPRSPHRHQPWRALGRLRIPDSTRTVMIADIHRHAVQKLGRTASTIQRSQEAMVVRRANGLSPRGASYSCRFSSHTSDRSSSCANGYSLVIEVEVSLREPPRSTRHHSEDAFRTQRYQIPQRTNVSIFS